MGVNATTRLNYDHTAFQAVILAGPGTSLEPLTQGIPKALLPVAGKPMLHYALQWIESAGIKEILIVSVTSATEALASFLKTLEGKRPDVAFVEDKLSSADALRKVKDRLKYDTLIFSVDSFPSEPAQILLDIFRVHDAGALVSYYPSETPDYWIGLTPLAQPILSKGNFAQLVTTTHIPSLEKSKNGLSVRMPMLREFPVVNMMKVLDSHVYIIRKDMMDLFLDENVNSLQKDGIPLLIRSQYITGCAGTVNFYLLGASSLYMFFK
jgi:molybdopterin-guanine dinucleotide biosynthesis protein A